jgi:hypothetical protein
MFPNEKGILPCYLGGLGNQLWVVAAGYCSSRIQGCPLYIPKNTHDNNKHDLFHTDYTESIFKDIGTVIDMPLPDAMATARKSGWAELRDSFGFQPWNPEQVVAGSLLNCYFQYYPPLKDFEHDIRNLLLKGIEARRKEMADTFNVKDAAFLHVRRGDYTRLPTFHYGQPSEYYEKGLRILVEEHAIKKVFVLSDDMGWVKEQGWFKKWYDKGIVEDASPPHELDALALMSLCTGGAICANSTFSWWGAFLGAYAKRAPVVVPDHWIAERTVHLIPDDWIVLSTTQSVIPRIRGDGSTTFVTLSDAAYLPKAIKTIQELRGPGKWDGPVVLLTVDCTIPYTLATRYNILQHPIERINTDTLVAKLRTNPIKPMEDNRHFGKLTQWTKFRVFEPFLKQWDRVIFLDAGIRVFDTVQPLLDIPWKGRFLAPDDCGLVDNGNRFRCQLDGSANPPVLQAILDRFGSDILNEHYFLNCLWIYDTTLLSQILVGDLEDAMNAYPISLCNEMGIMNLFFTFLLKVWSPLPFRVPDSPKILFGWSDRPLHGGHSWKDYHIVKYAHTA